MSKIYFPLSTNVHYWDLKRLDLSLESRMKLSVLLYEDLIFEDGGYTALIGPKMSLEIKGETDSLEDEFLKTGGEFAFEFNGVMYESPAQRRYNLSFRKILERKGLISEPWVKFTGVDFTEDGKEKLKQSVENNIKSFYDGNEKTYILQKHILKSIHHDWILGRLNQWDVNFDPHHESNFRKIFNLQNEDSSTIPIDFEIAFPKLPDLDMVSWEQILEARESPSSFEFRKYISKISNEATQALIAGENSNSIRYLLMELRDDQLIKEIENQLSTPKKTGIEITINLLFMISGFVPIISPFVSAVSGIKDIVEPLKKLSDDHKSLGAAFIRKQKQN